MTFHEVLDALLLLYRSQVRHPTSITPLSLKIRNNYRYFPYFEDCIGALDGTHIAAHIPSSLQPRYRNRKQFISQNVLACCDFDMRFTYLLAGWERSAHDQRVLQDARYNHGLELPSVASSVYAVNTAVFSPNNTYGSTTSNQKYVLYHTAVQ